MGIEPICDADRALHLAVGEVDGGARDRQRVREVIFGSPSLPELRSIAQTQAGCRAIVRGASFGFDLHGEDIFAAIARDHLGHVPQRGLAEHGSIADQVAAARRFLLDELGRIWGAHMEAMFESVDDAVAAGRPLTLAERNFVDHELLEASFVAEGMTQYDAHHRVHESIPPGANFSPHVIVEFQDRFGPENFRYWGLTKGGK